MLMTMSPNMTVANEPLGPTIIHAQDFEVWLDAHTCTLYTLAGITAAT
jgi:hypothetical protein